VSEAPWGRVKATLFIGKKEEESCDFTRNYLV